MAQPSCADNELIDDVAGNGARPTSTSDAAQSVPVVPSRLSFFGLSGEIRNRIYEYTFNEVEAPAGLTPLLVNRQFHAEAWRFAFNLAFFHVDHRFWNVDPAQAIAREQQNIGRLNAQQRDAVHRLSTFGPGYPRSALDNIQDLHLSINPLEHRVELPESSAAIIQHNWDMSLLLEYELYQTPARTFNRRLQQVTFYFPTQFDWSRFLHFSAHLFRFNGVAHYNTATMLHPRRVDRLRELAENDRIGWRFIPLQAGAAEGYEPFTLYLERPERLGGTGPLESRMIHWRERQWVDHAVLDDPEVIYEREGVYPVYDEQGNRIGSQAARCGTLPGDA